jgi:hypothetical protein
MKSVYVAFAVLACLLAVASAAPVAHSETSETLFSASASEMSGSSNESSSHHSGSGSHTMVGAPKKHHLPAHIVPMIVGIIGATLLVAIVLGVLKHKRDKANGVGMDNGIYEKIDDVNGGV